MMSHSKRVIGSMGSEISYSIDNWIGVCIRSILVCALSVVGVITVLADSFTTIIPSEAGVSSYAYPQINNNGVVIAQNGGGASGSPLVYWDKTSITVLGGHRPTCRSPYDMEFNDLGQFAYYKTGSGQFVGDVTGSIRQITNSLYVLNIRVNNAGEYLRVDYGDRYNNKQVLKGRVDGSVAEVSSGGGWYVVDINDSGGTCMGAGDNSASPELTNTGTVIYQTGNNLYSGATLVANLCALPLYGTLSDASRFDASDDGRFVTWIGYGNDGGSDVFLSEDGVVKNLTNGKFRLTSDPIWSVVTPSVNNSGQVVFSASTSSYSNRDIVLYSPGPAPVSLAVTVDPGSGYTGALSAIPLNYSLVGPSTYSGNLVFDDAGKAVIGGISPGLYSLTINGSHWLKRTVNEINVDGVNSVNTALTNGDADGDNQVNLFDFVTLDANFGSAFAMADLNGDSAVNLFDYVMIDTNFGALGD